MNQSSSSSGYFLISTILHVSAAVALVMAPQLQMLNEGSGHTVEFVTMETPHGEQLEKVPTIAPAAKPEPVTPPAPPIVKTKVTPTPVVKKVKVAKTQELPDLADLKPNSQTQPENLDSKIENAEAEKPTLKESVSKNNATQNDDSQIAAVTTEQLEQDDTKDLQETAPEEKVEDPYDELMANENQEQQEVAQHQDEQQKEDIHDDEKQQPIAAVTKPEAKKEDQQLEPIEDPTEKPTQELTEETAATEEQDQQKPLAAAIPVETSNEATKTSTPPNVPAQTAHTTNAAPQYGSPSAPVRNYLDLKQASGNRPPAYPTQARRHQQQGQVQLAYYVQSNGTVSNLRLVRSSGYPMLDQEAIQAVSKYRYQPGQAGWTVHPVNFQLQGPTKKMPSRLRTSQTGAAKSYN